MAALLKRNSKIQSSIQNKQLISVQLDLIIKMDCLKVTLENCQEILNTSLACPKKMVKCHNINGLAIFLESSLVSA